MAKPEIDLARITLPPEDEAIPRALAELEKQIGAWCQAAGEFQERFSRLTQQARSRQHADTPATDIPATDAPAEKTATQAATRSTKSTGDAPAASSSSSKQPGTTEPASRAPKPEDPNPQPAPESTGQADPAPMPPRITREMLAQSDPAKKTKGRGLAAKIRRAVGGEQPQDPGETAAAPVARPVHDDPDEALLATLDEKTAHAIRIKRRLCNNKKSVRELLDEM